MTADIRWFWRRLNANYWFYPALFATAGGVLGFLLVYLDRNGLADWLNQAQWFAPARPDGASNLLTVIAGSMIGVASTVFSITIVAVSFASGTYGPRLLINFMEDRGNQLSLATFIGTFVYATTVLTAVRAEDESPTSSAEAAATSLPGFVPQLSLLFAYALMVLSVAVLVYFLNHVPSAIRINNVLKRIGRRLISGIKETYPDRCEGEDERERPEGEPIEAAKTGYVQLIDFAGLAELGEKRECTIVLEVRTGDFLHPGMALARVSGNGPNGHDGEEGDENGVADAIRECFTFGAARTPEQDPQFLIDELVEIGLRALSPGINDPFTAITALHWLGAATSELGCRRLEKDICEGEQGDCPVIPLPDDFEHYLERGFGAMRSAVSTSHTAALVMLDTLRHAAAPISQETRRALLRRQGDMLIEQVRTTMQGPDLQELETRYVAFRAAMPG